MVAWLTSIGCPYDQIRLTSGGVADADRGEAAANDRLMTTSGSGEMARQLMVECYRPKVNETPEANSIASRVQPP